MVLQNPKDYGLREKRNKQKTQRNLTKSQWSYHKGKKVNKSGVYYNDDIVKTKNNKKKELMKKKQRKIKRNAVFATKIQIK